MRCPYVYKQVEMQFDENGNIIVPDDHKLTITVSYDEKPGFRQFQIHQMI